MNTNESLTCEACGFGSLEPFNPSEQVSYMFCSKCLLYQKGRAFSSEYYKEDYHENYKKAKNRKLRKASYRLRVLSCLLTSPEKRVLDVGCSLGYTVEAGAKAGWKTSGVDVCEDVVNECKRRGLDCQKIDSIALPYSDNQFDALTAWHVIEHLSDVKSVLREWLRVLKPGGVLAIEAPDASSPKVRKRQGRYRKFWKIDHVYVFSPASLKKILEDTGFEVVQVPSLRDLWKRRAVTGSVLFYKGFEKVRKRLGINKEFIIYARKPDNLNPK